MQNEHSLLPTIRRFFSSLTKNSQVLELAEDIQQKLELGNTAIPWIELLEDELISQDGDSGYIVVNNGLAGFRRFYNLERNIVNQFLNAVTIELEKHKIKSAIENVLEITNQPKPNSLDMQWQACLSSLHHTRFILSGGPGTGKTTTVIRLMLLSMNLNPKIKIALSAPTGKAANRMMQGINQILGSILVDEDSLKKLTQPAKTIHRLLGYNHETNKLKYNQNNPMPYDLVIIDESSMLDVVMADTLLQALKPSAQLILIGDKNQLPAVDAGNVFSDLCALFDKKQGDDLVNYYWANSKNKPQITNCIELTKNYRFENGSIIAKLCQCILSQDVKSLITLKSQKGFNLHNPQNKKQKLQLLSQWYQQIQKNESTILLSPINFGFNSVKELNELAKVIKQQTSGLHQGMPIMVTKNDYTLGIFNGDIGILKKVNDLWVVPFLIEGKKTEVNLDSIKAWVDAAAISIHKSQGSEYDHVLISLPDDNKLEILTNSLLYTAISRAKKSITIWSNEAILSKTINSNNSRTTFLEKYKIIEKNS